jgi:hypothetical protein
MNNPNQSPDLPVAGGIGLPSWGSGKTLSQALLAGAQGAPEGHNQPPLPVEPDKSVVNGTIPVTYPSQAGRRS